jgi:hypothetical protein
MSSFVNNNSLGFVTELSFAQCFPSPDSGIGVVGDPAKPKERKPLIKKCPRPTPTAVRGLYAVAPLAPPFSIPLAGGSTTIYNAKRAIRSAIILPDLTWIKPPSSQLFALKEFANAR